MTGLSDSRFVVLAVYNFTFSMIPTFRRVVKRQYHVSDTPTSTMSSTPSLGPIWRAEPSRRLCEIRASRTTLRDWHRHTVVNKNWFPFAEGNPPARPLDPECPAPIAAFLCNKYVQPGIGATRTHRNILCLDSDAAQTDDERHFERFCCRQYFSMIWRDARVCPCERCGVTLCLSRSNRKVPTPRSPNIRGLEARA
jgi:hypothetical protein